MTKMKMKLGEVNRAWAPLVKLADKELPIGVAYKLGKIVKAVSEEIQAIEEHRMGLVKKYGSVQDGMEIRVDDQKMAPFTEDWAALLETEVILDIEPLGLDFLKEISYINMTARDMAFLKPFISDLDDDTPKKSTNKKD